MPVPNNSKPPSARRGQYRITGSNLQEKAQNFKLDREKERDLRLEVDIPPDIDLSGKVVLASDAKHVVAEVTVTAVPIPSDIKSGLRGKGFSAVSSTAGTFAIRRSPVEMLVTARSADNLLGAIVTLDADAKQVEIPLVPTASIRGRLVDPDMGKPLVGQRVSYSFVKKFPGGLTVHSQGNFVGTATSDPDGKFTLTGLLVGGDYTLQLIGPADRTPRERVSIRSLKVERAEVIELGDVKGKAT